ncbi:MAG: hypothetical protein CSH37_12625 [Thalassolituus sp.]|nr:MAG: hypothetical protein CSH37_12625 [Thalassolituus sp.]
MKLEYKNGVRITKFAHEKDAFEAALDGYEHRLKTYYASSSRTETEDERRRAVAEAMSFLNIERAKLSTIASLQDQLRDYRTQGMKATSDNSDMWSRAEAFDVLQAESHHGYNGVRVLERNMAAEGVPKPSSRHTAHHICPGKGKLPAISRQTRVHLHTHGIRINDPANGVYLMTRDKETPHWSMPDSRGHKTYHTEDYERLVWERLSHLNGQDKIKTQLQVIGRLMQQNNVTVMIDKAGETTIA